MEQQERIRTTERVHAVGSFDAELASVPAARRFVADHLSGFFTQLDVALLVASELVTNAVQHAASPFTIEVLRGADGVRLIVRDQSTAQVLANVPPSHVECGRGLNLVEALSSAWGVQLAPNGKSVWADIPCR